MDIAAEKTTTTESSYSILVSNEQEPTQTQVQGQSFEKKTTTESLRRSPSTTTKAVDEASSQQTQTDSGKSDMEKYQDMEEDVLNQAILEGESGSSSSNESNKDTTFKQPQAKDASAKMVRSFMSLLICMYL